MAADTGRILLPLMLLLTLAGGAQAGDPTRPPGWGSAAAVAATPMPELTLQQVSIRGDQALAVINNQVVRKGDRIDGAQVLAILPGRVLIKFRQKTLELSLLTDTRRSSQ